MTLQAISKVRADPLSVRWWAATAVLVLHAIVLLALLREHVKRSEPEAIATMRWIALPPEKPAPMLRRDIPSPPGRQIAPSVTLPLPQFTVSVPERPRPSPITIAPTEQSQQGRRDYNDLFSVEKKEQLKRFFAEQATMDRRENARAGKRSSPCDAFKKPDDLGAAGEPPNNGVSKNFKPGFTVGTGGSDDDEGLSAHPCN